MRDTKTDLDMLQALLTKKSWVQKTQEQTGRRMSAATTEVDRQITQTLQKQKVTKSGEED